VYAQGAEFRNRWGPERAARAMPVHSWLAAGAALSAGTDYPAAEAEPLLGVWGLITRRTRRAGVLGPEEAVEPYTACWLATAAGAALSGEEGRRGTLQPGRLADLVAFPADPVAGPVDALPTLRPAFTIVGGRVVYDPQARLGRPG